MKKSSLVFLIGPAVLICGCTDTGDKDGFGSGSADPGSVSLVVDEEPLASGFVNAGEVISFPIELDNSTGYVIDELTFAFQISSVDPDGNPGDVHWDDINGTSTGAITSDMFDQGTFITKHSGTVDNDIVAFWGFSDAGRGIDEGFQEVAYTVEVGPIDHLYLGHSICIDKVDHPVSEEWAWSNEGVDAIPDWDGPHCFTIRPRDQVYVAQIDGSDAPGTVNAGEVITFHIALNNNTERPLRGSALGFLVYSLNPDVTWTEIRGERTGDIETYLDMTSPIMYFEPETGGQGVGFGDVTTAGLPDGGYPSGTFEVCYLVHIGPIPEEFIGEEICLDKSDIITESTTVPWEWAFVDGSSDPEDAFPPTWSGLACFTVVAK